MSAQPLRVIVVLAVLGAGGCGGGGSPPRHDVGSAGAVRTPAEATATATPRQSAAWTQATVLRRIAGHRIAVGRTSVRIDPRTVVCGGVGRPVAERGGRAAWARFRCVQPTFPSGKVVGPDAIFFVAPTGPRTFTVTDVRLTRY